MAAQPCSFRSDTSRTSSDLSICMNRPHSWVESKCTLFSLACSSSSRCRVSSTEGAWRTILSNGLNLRFAPSTVRLVKVTLRTSSVSPLTRSVTERITCPVPLGSLSFIGYSISSLGLWISSQVPPRLARFSSSRHSSSKFACRCAAPTNAHWRGQCDKRNPALLPFRRGWSQS